MINADNFPPNARKAKVTFVKNKIENNKFVHS